MIILGLTGSIGMGKSTTATMFSDAGIPVHDADAAVHALYTKKPLVDKIEKAFPGTTDNNGVNRKALGQVVLGNSTAIKKLEKIVHPMVQEVEQDFVKKHRLNGTKLLVLDIPLLFETQAENRVDKIVVVTAPAEVQRNRVLSRPNMTVEKFEKILARQIPDAEKRKRADFIIDTSLGMENARRAVDHIIEALCV